MYVFVQAAADRLKIYNKMSISVTAACEVFNRYVTRTHVDIPEFDQAKQRIIERGERFSERSVTSREKIAELVGRFIRDQTTLLLHGCSRVVITCCKNAAAQGRYFSVVVTEGRPNFSGYKAAKQLSDAGIPVTVILDSAMASHMENVDLVLLGAEGIVENGGMINQIGSYQVAIVAKAYNKPVYVAAESYKFARIFPLNESDTPESKILQEPFEALNGYSLPSEVTIDNPTCDYTPASYITLLFTDIGILTPSAVSDELIKLYY